MGINQTKSLTHWNYFLALESDLLKVARYIEPNKENYNAYSLELARLLLSAASEVDVLLKAICKREQPSVNAKSINGYMDVITTEYPEFEKYELRIPRWGLKLTPWSNWSKKQVPLWWTAYNKVKHHRDDEFRKANLKNSLNAVGGLFIVNLYFYLDIARDAKLSPIQSLFRVNDARLNGFRFNGDEFGYHYAL